MRVVLVSCATALALGLAGCTDERASRGVDKEKLTMKLTSSDFTEGAPIPKKHAYTGEGNNVSPALSWSGVPDAAKELALICDDPDAPRKDPWVHWVLYKIPTSAHGLKEGDAGGALKGKNGWNEPGWGGPMPPKGHGRHRYYFRVYALDAALGLKAGATKQELLKAMEGHILAEGQLMGTYERK